MTTIKSYTDLNQSKKLAEILPIESADMYYQYALPKSDKIRYNPILGNPIEALEWYNKGYIHFGKNPLTLNEYCIPCWSLSALLGLMPTDDKKDEYYVVIESHSDYHTVSYRNCWDGCVHSDYSEESLLDAAFKMICWLKENNKL